MRRWFQSWADNLDPSVRSGDNDLRSWGQFFIASLVVMIVAAFVPGPSDFFQLSFPPAAALMGVACVVGVSGNLYDRIKRFSLLNYARAVLVNSFFLHLAAYAQIIYSEKPGAFVMGALPLLVACFHGYNYRATPSHPFVPLVGVVAAACAFALRPSAEHAAIFAIVTPACVGGALMLGTIGLRAQHQRNKHEALRSAISAQMLDERAAAVNRLSETLLEILRRNHDAGNALSTSLLTAEALAELTKGRIEEPAEIEDMHEVALTLRDALGRLKRLVDETRQIGRGQTHSSTAEPANPAEVAAAVVREVGARFPEVAVELRVAERATGHRVGVSGGSERLHDVLTNLLVNACEGNGRRGATRVLLSIDLEPAVSVVAIQVVDDGPGFSPELLANPITGFHTSKPNGMGLGLYTAERLLRASG
ncbi:MAG: HAMP domain-containing histidine kinase, partial [Proteobacteria bacterium]|nr:HAMP domain-containing histidine kinase [Pseudomonadota bacterium]